MAPITEDGIQAELKFAASPVEVLEEQIRSWTQRIPVVTTTYKMVPMVLPAGHGMDREQLLALLVAIHDAERLGHNTPEVIDFQHFGGSFPVEQAVGGESGETLIADEGVDGDGADEGASAPALPEFDPDAADLLDESDDEAPAVLDTPVEPSIGPDHGAADETENPAIVEDGAGGNDDAAEVAGDAGDGGDGSAPAVDPDQLAADAEAIAEAQRMADLLKASESAEGGDAGDAGNADNGDETEPTPDVTPDAPTSSGRRRQR